MSIHSKVNETHKQSRLESFDQILGQNQAEVFRKHGDGGINVWWRLSSVRGYSHTYHQRH